MLCILYNGRIVSIFDRASYIPRTVGSIRWLAGRHAYVRSQKLTGLQYVTRVV